MTTPTDGSGGSADDTSAPASPDPAPVSIRKDAAADEPQPPFDPYRFGAPEHPIPPEYAPPGYQPPVPPAPPVQPPPAPPVSGYPPADYPYGPPPGYGPGYPPPGYQPYGGYPPPGPPFYPPPGYPGYPPPRTSNGKAIAALVLGIASIVFFWTTFFDLLLIIPALVLGFLGLDEARKRGGDGSAMARAGLICTAVGTVLAIAFTIFAVHRVNHCTDLYGSSGHAYDNCIRHI